MSVVVGSLPKRFASVTSTEHAIARLSRPDGPTEPVPFNGKSVSPSAMAKRGRIARGEDVRPHVIGSVRFGPDRLTTCATCAFTATGATDRAMAVAWDAHPIAVRQAFARARRAASRM